MPELLEARRKRGDKCPVWIVEGEKCADAVAKVLTSDDPEVVTLVSYARNADFARADLEPLAGLPVLLIADADDKSRNEMVCLGKILVEKGCAVRHVQPPGHDGSDVADALRDGGKAGLRKWIETVCGGASDHESMVVDTAVDAFNDSVLADNDYYRIIGTTNDMMLKIQSKITWEVVLWSRERLINENLLISIAPAQFWNEMAGNVNELKRTNLVQLADSIIRCAERKGMVPAYDSQSGRGCAQMDDGAIQYNTGGNVLIQDGRDGMLTKAVDFSKVETIYQPGAAIELKQSKRGKQYLSDFHQAVMRYRWQKPDYGRCVIGWMATSLVGGCLDFRPMVWLIAPHGTGKTWLFTHVIQKFMGPLMTNFGSATEAAIATRMGGDSLPCYLDEFEPNRENKDRTNAVLSLIRLASGGDSERSRGSSTGKVTSTAPRFSIAIASIDRPVLSSANSSRFAMCHLDRKGVKDWADVSKAILDSVAPDRSLAMRSRIIAHAPLIRSLQDRHTRVLEKQGCGSRMALLYGALSAGSEFISGDGRTIIPDIPESDDNFVALATIMQSAVRHPSTNKEMVISECLRGSATNQDLKRLCHQHGMEYDHVNHELWLACSHKQLRNLLRYTDSEAVSLRGQLAGVEGVASHNAAGKPLRRSMAGIRCSVINVGGKVLDEIGFLRQSEMDEE